MEDEMMRSPAYPGTRVLLVTLALALSLFLSLVVASALAQDAASPPAGEEEVIYESKVGAVLEDLTMLPYDIVTGKMEKYPWDPEKTRFLSRGGAEVGPWTFLDQNRGRTVMLYLDVDGMVVMAEPVAM